MYKSIIVVLIALLCTPIVFAQSEDITLAPTPTPFVNQRLERVKQYRQMEIHDFSEALGWGIFRSDGSDDTTEASFVIIAIDNAEMIRSRCYSQSKELPLYFSMRIEINVPMPPPSVSPKPYTDWTETPDRTIVDITLALKTWPTDTELYDTACLLCKRFLEDATFVTLCDE